MVPAGYLVIEDHGEKVSFNSHRCSPDAQETLNEMAGTKPVGLWILEAAQLKNLSSMNFLDETMPELT